MKNILRGLLFWTIIIGFILVLSALANILAEVITMKQIMTVVYIALGFSFIYLLRN